MEIKSQKDLISIDKKWKNIKFKDSEIHIKNIKDFITDEHIDIIVRYLYIKSYIEGVEYDKYKMMYEKMMKKRVNKSYYNEFNKIIDSFNKHGYLKEYPIPINNKGKMLNGSHRLACCLYFNINPYVCIFDEEDHEYNIEWFHENGFTSEEIIEIEKTKEKLLKKYSFNKVYLKNVYAATITPIKNGNLDTDYFYKHISNLKKNNIDGLFLCGNTGNGMNLNFNLKKEVLEYVNKISKEYSLIFHVGSQNTQDIEKMIILINKSNASCIASMPPYHIITKFNEIKQFYERIAKLSTKPVLIYHIPNITRINLPAEEIIELLNINNVIGIKYTDSDLEKLKTISENVKDKYIFYGKDDLLLNGLLNGANAGIGGCYNIFPSFIYKIMNGNTYEERLDNQNKLNYAIKVLRKKFPTLPGSEFVSEVLKIKADKADEEFYRFLEEEHD